MPPSDRFQTTLIFLHGDLIFGLELGSPDFACNSFGESSSSYAGFGDQLTKHLLQAA